MKARMPSAWLKPDGTWRDPEGRILCPYCGRFAMEQYTICVHCKTPFHGATLEALDEKFKSYSAPKPMRSTSADESPPVVGDLTTEGPRAWAGGDPGNISPPKCDRCRKKADVLTALTVELTGGSPFHVSVCDPCKRSFQETIPEALRQWKRGALYIKDDRLFLADEGTYGGILRTSSEKT